MWYIGCQNASAWNKLRYLIIAKMSVHGTNCVVHLLPKCLYMKQVTSSICCQDTCAWSKLRRPFVAKIPAHGANCDVHLLPRYLRMEQIATSICCQNACAGNKWYRLRHPLIVIKACTWNTSCRSLVRNKVRSLPQLRHPFTVPKAFTKNRVGHPFVKTFNLHTTQIRSSHCCHYNMIMSHTL